jgi:hypothetical protein
MSLTSALETATPANADRPFWLREPCPSWCTTAHHDADIRDDRVHSGGGAYTELTLEPKAAADGGTFAATVCTGMWQYWRDARPHVCISISDRVEIYLELDEAEGVARLLASPPGEWEAVVLTMMEPDDVPPPGHRGEGRPQPEHVRFLASPFSRPPVFAVRRAPLDEVLVFTHALTDCHTPWGEDQAPRYLAFTPAEAAEMAAVIIKLLDGAK